jgi:regulator of protease activity HflC (stomatin/prohibitin superfamily)
MTKFFSQPINFLFLILLTLLIFTPFTIINAGERGVLISLGEVQTKILEEGIHPLIPGINTVKKLSIRIQKQEIDTEASTKDLQEIFTKIALNWHINPEKANLLFQEIGEEEQIINYIINPAIQESVKAVIAKYTAEEIISKRAELKQEIDKLLTTRLMINYLIVDNVSLIHVDFSDNFIEAVEAKQIAEQDAKKAGFRVIKSMRDAEVKINLAKGEAEANYILQQSLSNKVLIRQMINKWDGNLPLIMGEEQLKLLHLELDDINELQMTRR